SADLEATLRRALAAGELRAAVSARVVAALDAAALSQLQGDVVLLDIDPGNRGEMQLLVRFLAEHDGLPVLATSARLDVAAMREFLRIGVLDVVPQPFDGAELVAALRQAATRRRPAAGPVRRGVVLTLMASSGGVGVTSLAVQGACALARRHKEERICVLDLGIQFGCAALLLDAEQRASVLDLVNTPDRIDAELLHGAMVRPHGRFDLLAAPAAMCPIDDIDAAAITKTIAAVSAEYTLTIVDLPLLWTHWTHAALRASGVVALVVDPTVPSLRQGRRQIDVLRQEELDDIPLAVVANRVGGRLFGRRGVPLKAAATALGRSIDHAVPDSAAMRAAGNAGLPLNEVGGGKAIEKKLAAVLDRVVKAAAPAAAG
ncbi:MAG TPA: hypothetical protein VFX74_08315, partial [Candidatus Limnocylindria bacterium]|nr:hypothetical protein [Candidatus Limnocylindria bacterium]